MPAGDAPRPLRFFVKDPESTGFVVDNPDTRFHRDAPTLPGISVEGVNDANDSGSNQPTEVLSNIQPKQEKSGQQVIFDANRAHGQQVLKLAGSNDLTTEAYGDYLSVGGLDDGPLRGDII